MQEPSTNHQVILAARPEGYPREGDFSYTEVPIPEVRDGQALVKILWLSLDPYERGRMNEAQTYATSVAIGGIMAGGAVGKVVASRREDLPVGEYVEGSLGWQEYALSEGQNLRRLDPHIAPLSTSLGVLGMPGLTAYFGLFEIGRPEPGDTVVVSAASGAVGAVVGQLAKMAGCYVVGIAGTSAKIEYIENELGFNRGVSYREERFPERLAEACPEGVNVYFDNVGGDVTDAVFDLLADRARVALCGQISQYNLERPDLGPRNLRSLVGKQVKVEGFLVWRFANRAEAARRRLTQWLVDGKLKYREDIVEGLQNAPSALIGMMHGANFGKLLIKVSDEQS
jgi:NADPH-dependent curcumin reductase CurA